jgi:hypothetical protein
LAAEKLVAKSGDEFLAGDEINAVTFIEGGGALKNPPPLARGRVLRCGAGWISRGDDHGSN